jgi:YD repeat-containing protein
MKAKYIYLIIAVFFNCLAHAQSDSRNNNGKDDKNDSINGGGSRSNPTVALSQIIPASPKASAMTKYGDYPVSLYTGLVDITVPIYTIKVKDIEVPIEFKYHASGIKYDDISLEVGLGWSLIAGGVIDFAQRGKSTNSTVFKKNVANINTTGNCYNEDLASLLAVANGNLENPIGSFGVTRGEADIYTFSFLQYSGQFIVPYDDYGPPLGPAGAVFVPAYPLKLQSEYPLVILDASGTAYNFEEKENIDNNKRKSFCLTKIISADKADTVYFNYTTYSPLPGNEVSRPHINKTRAIIDESPYSGFHGGFSSTDTYESGGLYPLFYYPPRLNSISFPGGRVEFGYYNNIATSRDLRTVKVYNNLSSSTPLQTISLVKSQFAGNRGDRLDQVTFQNQQGDSYNYQFGYNGNPDTNPSGIDYWGYYNGQGVSNYDFLPDFVVPRLGFPNGYQIGTMNRSANEWSMKSGILNKIIYPTKGYTEFVYEAHRAWNMTYGGLRIKEIYNYDSGGTLAEKKWYRYGANESGQGRAAAYPTVNDFVISSQTLVEYEDPYVAPLLGYVIYNRQFLPFPKQNYFTSGSSVVYPCVTEYVGNGTTDIGKTIYTFEDFLNEDNSYLTEGVVRQSTLDMPSRTYEWKNGKLNSKYVFKKENNTYIQIYSLSNSYNDVNTKEYINLRVLPYIFLASNAYNGANLNILTCYDTPDYSDYKIFIAQSPVDYFNYYITTGLHVLSSSTETVDGVTKVTNYTNNAYGFPTLVTSMVSDKMHKTAYKYPSELSGTVVYNEMISRNIVAPVVETRDSVNNVFTAFHRTNYAAGHPNNANLIAPVSEDYQRGDQGAAETRITYNRYDPKGNPVHITKDGADQVVYLWGYNHRYPIAEIKGATYSDVTTKISEANLNIIAAKNEPVAGDWTTINNLRTQLSGAMVTTYEYKPLVGMTKMKDPREVITEYEYDTFGRLKRVTQAGRVIEEYEYHYKN